MMIDRKDAPLVAQVLLRLPCHFQMVPVYSEGEGGKVFTGDFRLILDPKSCFPDKIEEFLTFIIGFVGRSSRFGPQDYKTPAAPSTSGPAEYSGLGGAAEGEKPCTR